MVEARGEMIIEEAHYQTLLARQTQIMIQNTDTIYISNRFVCIFIPKTTKTYSPSIFKLILIAGSCKCTKNTNYVHSVITAEEQPQADCF